MAIRLEPLPYEGPSRRLEGLVAYDDTEPPRPGVLIIHTALGRSVFEDEVAEALARQGYTALSADFYGPGNAPPSVDLAVETATRMVRGPGGVMALIEASLAALSAHPAVDPSRLAAMGYCLGGKAVLDLARAGGEVAGVISLHGGLNPAATPAVRPIKPRILVLHGWDDAYVTPDQVAPFAREMTEAGADWQLHAYGQTGHAFADPHEPHKAPGVGYNPVAARRSWKALTDFMAELFA
jgi:dienelactone hydrolase